MPRKTYWSAAIATPAIIAASGRSDTRRRSELAGDGAPLYRATIQPPSGKTIIAQPHILVDADACPVKDEIYRVAWRTGARVTVVSNAHLRIPAHPLLERVVVDAGFDAADDWIAGRADASAVVVTADILLADRCLKAGATVIAPNGKPFTPNSIGNAVAVRAIMSDLRAGGERIGGPPPFGKEDRSRFLSALDVALTRLFRQG